MHNINLFYFYEIFLKRRLSLNYYSFLANKFFLGVFFVSFKCFMNKSIHFLIFRRQLSEIFDNCYSYLV